jgi:hypothetical protein
MLDIAVAALQLLIVLFLALGAALCLLSGTIKPPARRPPSLPRT